MTGGNCIACDKVVPQPRRGMVAPFLARRVWNRPAFPASLAKCASCGCAFFSPRFEPSEAERLYHNYRDEEYQQLRFHFEPWYTEELNRHLIHDPAVLSLRRHEITQVVGQWTDPKSIRNILDFGGDKGQLIQTLLQGDKWVYDISGVQPLEGVHPLLHLDERSADGYDLILCSHVLEHVSSPAAILQGIRGLCGRDSLFLLEVPAESPFSVSSIAKRIVQYIILCATRWSSARELLDPALIYVMHEHVNFFSRPSLEVLLTRTGFDLLASGSYVLPITKWFRPRTFWCIAKPLAEAHE
ncbi:MAG TPA: class I SAM-dependent methyltransferase [Bryobacteraceae bacterium]|nr:class I SAM-dependent methyltransferase [Bryobacteraceae bacterium]